jgi:hypothetical protein
MTREKHILVLFAGVVLMILGIFSLIASFRVFSGNAYVLYGMLALGALLIMAALLTRVRGSIGLGMAGVWFISMALILIHRVNFMFDETAMGILAILAGLLMILGV